MFAATYKDASTLAILRWNRNDDAAWNRD